jgi:hypothetical protein
MTFAYTPGDPPENDHNELVRWLREEVWRIKRGLDAVDPAMPLTLINAWTIPTGSQLRVPACRMDPFGEVHLQGGITAGVSGTVAWVAPRAHWPKTGTVRLNLRGTGNDFIDIDTSGNATVTTSSVYTALDGLSYWP